MKTPTRYSFSAAVIAAVVLGLLSAWNAGRARAATVTIIQSGMVGISQEQTARLNVVNIGSEDIPVVATWYDSEGKVLFQCNWHLAPGHAVFEDANGDQLIADPADPAARVEIRADVVVDKGADPSLIQNLISTIEVFDSANGRTWELYALPPASK